MTSNLLDKLTVLLRKEFAGSTPELEPVKGNGRVWGVLYWDAFDGVDQIERQERLWAVLKAHLTPEEQHDVAAILTMTRREVSDD